MRCAAVLLVLALPLGACSAQVRRAESVTPDPTIDERSCQGRGPFVSLEGVTSLAEAERRLAHSGVFHHFKALLVERTWLDPPRTDVFGRPLIPVYYCANAKRFSNRPALTEISIERFSLDFDRSDAVVGIGFVRETETGMETGRLGIAEQHRVALSSLYRGSPGAGRELLLVRSGGVFELAGKLACTPYDEFHPILKPGQQILLVATIENRCFPQLASFWQAVPIDALVDPDSATGADAQLARAALENPAFASWFSVHGARECPTRKD